MIQHKQSTTPSLMTVQQFTDKHQFTKDYQPDNKNTFSECNQPSSESKKDGWQKKRALQDMSKMIFDELTKHSTMEEAIEVIRQQVKAGELKDFLALLKIIKPKDVDEKEQPIINVMPSITKVLKSGEVETLEFNVGEPVDKE